MLRGRGGTIRRSQTVWWPLTVVLAAMALVCIDILKFGLNWRHCLFRQFGGLNLTTDCLQHSLFLLLVRFVARFFHKLTIVFLV